MIQPFDLYRIARAANASTPTISLSRRRPSHSRSSIPSRDIRRMGSVHHIRNTSTLLNCVMLTNKMHLLKLFQFNSSCLLHVSNILRSSSGRLYCTCSLIWNINHVCMKAVCQNEEVTQSCMYNIVFRIMSIRCSKHVEDKKNLIKTLI